MAKFKNAETTGLVISHWLSTRYTVEFMGLWEKMNNPLFNVTEFSNIKNESGSNGFVLSAKQWIEKTNAVGIISKPGRYGSGTFAHKDIAFEFGSWISPEFKYYLIKEYQRLKEAENQRLHLEWNLQRTLAKVNYRIHTDAIKEKIIPQEITPLQASSNYASEADLLNVALFGKTAAQWRAENPEADSNVRDSSHFGTIGCIEQHGKHQCRAYSSGLPQGERLRQLNAIAITQLKSLLGNKQIAKLK